MTLPPKLNDPKPTRDARLRAPAHLDWVRSHACCVGGCSGRPIEAAHVRTGTGAGVGMKPGDDWTISLCRDHHARQHAIGEAAFENETGVDMRAMARAFAARSPKLAQARARQRAKEGRS